MRFTAVCLFLLALVGGTLRLAAAPSHIVTVAKSGGDYSTIQAAINAVTGTASQPVLVRVAPGIYSETVTMKPYVDVEGAGEDMTSILSHDSFIPTLTTADHSELRDLTVEWSGGKEGPAWAIQIPSGSPSVRNVTAIGQHGPYYVVAVNCQHPSSPVLKNLTLQSSSYGLWNDAQTTLVDSSITIYASDLGGGDGIYNAGGLVVLRNVTVDVNSIRREGLDVAPNLAYGIAGSVSGMTRLYGSRVSATANGRGAQAYALSEDAADAEVYNSVLSAGGDGATSYGVQTISGIPEIAHIRVHDSTVTAGSYTVFGNATSVTQIAASQLLGPGPVGPVTCAGVSDGTYTFYPAACPP
jgi:hypothetical protein